MLKHKTVVKCGSKALEMSMRDVLDGIHESSTRLGYQAAPGTLEILSIEAPRDLNHLQPQTHQQRHTQVKQHPIHRTDNVVSFLFERESRNRNRLIA